MGQLVKPECYWVGYSEMNEDEIFRYLKDSGNESFMESVREASSEGLSSAEILCSLFAKLCYKSLSIGQNANITKTRNIEDNIRGCFDVGHGSIFEHVGFNFIIANCSRVFTHELVRHRIGTAFSQNSGRYIRLDNIDLVFDPILSGTEDLVLAHLQETEDLVYKMECVKGLRVPPKEYSNVSYLDYLDRRDRGHGGAEERKWVPNTEMEMGLKKKLTSAIRRIAPNGQANEIAFSVNIRALRHTIMLRTSRYAEWEIRLVFEKLYRMLQKDYPTIFHGAKEDVIDGIVEVSGMRTQPYEKEGV